MGGKPDGKRHASKRSPKARRDAAKKQRTEARLARLIKAAAALAALRRVK